MSDTEHTETNRTSAADDAELEREVAEAFGGQSIEELMASSAAPEPQAVDSSAPPDGQAEADRPFEYELKRGRINLVRGDEVFVDLVGDAGKLQGVVLLKQFDRPPRVGSVMDFVVERIDESEGLIHLSREGAISQVTWDKLQRGTVVEARVVATNKGGLELEMVGRIKAFMPVSQIDLHHVESTEHFVGQKLVAMVQQINRRAEKVVLSRRWYLEHERQLMRDKLLAELEPGQEREGTVTNVVEFGAFVDLGGFDGLVHVSDMSYTRVDKPSAVVELGQRVKVKVLKVDKEHQKIQLGMKQIQPDPWEGIDQRVHVGEQVTGRVVRNADFGAFVEIEPGVEGLLPVSEVSWKRIHKPSDVLSEGDVIQLQVIKLDAAKRRISLSLKQAAGDPWSDIQTSCPRHSVVEGTVVRTTEYGAFVELEPGVEGLVHISELSERRVKNVAEVVKVGQPYKFRVIELNPDNRRIKLSLKAAQEQEPTASQGQEPPSQRKRVRTIKKGDLKGGIGGGGGMGQGLGKLRL